MSLRCVCMSVFSSPLLCVPQEPAFLFLQLEAVLVSSLGSLAVLLPCDSCYFTRQPLSVDTLFFFCHTRERLLLSLSESYRCMACRCALAPFPPFLSSHVFKILSFVFFVPIRFVFAPCSPTRPFLFLMHRKCVSSGVYQVCALRTVPDSMSQVGSGRCPEFCAVGIMSVVSVRALVEAYMYGLRIRLYRRGSLEEIV